MTGTLKDVADKLRKSGYEVLVGKGGFFVKGHGHWSNAKARKVTDIHAPKRSKRNRVLAYGDYATIAALNGQLKG